MPKISLFSHINETKNPTYLSVEHALDRIKTGYSAVLVKKIRDTGDNNLKMTLPCVCFSGSFKHRSKDGIIQHSGLICLDYDHCDVPQKKEVLKSDKFTFACWTSPSGTGVKCLVKVPPAANKHELYFDALRENYPDIDRSGRDVCRVCYESYDPEIYINNTSEVWDKLIERQSYDRSEKPPMIPVTEDEELIKLILKWLDNSGERFQEGNRNVWVMKAAGAFNRFGMPESSAGEYLGAYACHGFTRDEILKTVRSAYRNTAQHNTSYFENIKARKEIRSGIRSGMSDQQLVGTIIASTKADETCVRQVIEEERNKAGNKLEVFWDVRSSGKIELNRKRFIAFLHDNGFSRYRLSDKYVIFVRVVDNQVWEVGINDMKMFTLDWIMNMEDYEFDGINKTALHEYMLKNIKPFFDESLMTVIPEISLDLNEDKWDTAYLYYINGAVEVKADSVRMINYCDLVGKVWKNQIIERHIVLTDKHGNNSYTRFLERITETPEKAASLASVIGYLLHKYKDKRISKAPILTDQQSNENPEGGSGKGLIIDGIRNMRKVVTINGKTFDCAKPFAFQRIEVDTELIFIDDIPRGFKFESLFSIITEGIAVEKKNKGEYFIPYEKSPKIVIATNYYLKGEGASNDRRKVDIEINNYFNARHTPFDEYGETLFQDWNNNTWNDFDNSMIFMCRYYLGNGIVEMNNESIHNKKLQANTCAEFVEFASQIQVDTEINRRELYDSFTSAYPGYSKTHMRTFIKWIESWCAHNGWRLDKDHRRSHNDFYIYISTHGSSQAGGDTW